MSEFLLELYSEEIPPNLQTAARKELKLKIQKSLEEEVMRELRPMAQIAPDLISANKQSLNQAYEIMGFKTALSMGWSWHTLSGHVRPGAGDFGDAMREGGLKNALEWRDGAYKNEGFV